VPPAITGLNYEALRRRMGKYKKILDSRGTMEVIEGNSSDVTVLT